MPSYDHKCSNCNHEWEDTYSIKAEVPNTCPNCNKEGFVKRLISSGTSANVILEGRELVQKLWKEGKDLARQARTNEKLAHNLYGSK
jgi:putative FmdB family regulatory protein